MRPDLIRKAHDAAAAARSEAYTYFDLAARYFESRGVFTGAPALGAGTAPAAAPLPALPGEILTIGASALRAIAAAKEALGTLCRAERDRDRLTAGAVESIRFTIEAAESLIV